MKVSVIIPIYKVEPFIVRCVTSLFEQTLDGVEFIFIDDATPDNSINILEKVVEEYPLRKNSIKIIRHEVNQGLPAARNHGLKVAIGEYVYHCDSDDFIELDLLESLYVKAKETDADIVWCDWFLSFEHNERYMKQPNYETSEEALRGILEGKMKYNVWNKLVKRSLYLENGIVFPNGHGMGEDMTMIRLFTLAHRVAYVPKAFYHYVRLNTEAFTNAFSEKHLADLLYNTQETICFLKDKKGIGWEKEIGCFLLNVKFPFLISADKEVYCLWNKWFPESNAFIWKNKQSSWRSKLLQYAASKRWFIIVWLHYRCVHQLIYGVIYR